MIENHTLLEKQRWSRLKEFYGKCALSYQQTIILTTALIHTLSLALPIMTLQVYDRIIARHNEGTLWVLVTGVCVAIALECMLRIFRSYISGIVGAVYEQTQARKIHSKVLNSNLSYMKKYSVGEHIQNIAGLNRMRDFYGEQSIALIIDVPFMAVFLVMILYLSGWLVMVPIFLLSAFVLAAFHVASKLQTKLQERHDEDERRVNFMIRCLENISAVKGLGIEPVLTRKYEAIHRQANCLNYSISSLHHQINTLTTIFSQIMIISVATAGAPMVVFGDISVGTLIACILLSGRMMQPIQRAVLLLTKYQEIAISQKKMQKVEQLPQMNYTASGTHIKNTGELSCKGVAFRYEEEGQAVVDGVDLELKPGAAISIRGDYSSGKSTLLKLMAGIYKPSRGEIRVNGVSSCIIPPHEMVKHVGLMSTQGELFRGTIMDNLSHFKQENRDQAETIASLLGIDEAVGKLSKGYNTMIEAAYNDVITPGLKQRISIARALLFKPKLLLFDAADRGLDKEGYNTVYSLLGQLKGKATLVIVSDDKNMLQLADQHYVMRRGKLYDLEDVPQKSEEELRA